MQRALLLLTLVLAPACREGSENSNAQAAFLPIPTASGDGSSCRGVGLTPSATPTALSLASTSIGPSSQLTAESGSQLLFVTGGDGSVVQIDVSGGSPVETTLVAPGVIDALLASPLIGISTPAELAGVCVIDSARLGVLEATSNTVLQISRLVPDTVSLLAGFPDEIPGFADGPRLIARFSLTGGSRLVATGENTLLVADSGNHRVRRVELTNQGFVSSLAGLGSPTYLDGALPASGFDTPSGIALACSGEILVVESGAAGQGGHRLREISVGGESFFGLLGSVATLAGDGLDMTVGGPMASLAGPTGLLSTSDGEVYFVDGSTGFLRRHVLATGETDCPGFADCATATAGPAPFTGANASVALDDVSGLLYVLDPSAGTISSL